MANPAREHNHQHHPLATHTHQGQNHNHAFAAGVAFNTGFVIVEFGFGLASGSLALIADAGHNLSDVISLLLAWGAEKMARRDASPSYTYGLRRATILASLFSAVLLLLTLGGIAWESISRLWHPQPVAGPVLVTVAVIGVLINTATALLFMKGGKTDLNIRGAFLHMAADAAVSLGVACAGGIIMVTGWNWVDPLISLLVVALIVVGAWGLLRDSLNLSLDGVPGTINLPAVCRWLTDHENVLSLHDLHVWALSTTENALTVHLVVKNEALACGLPQVLQQQLHDHFGIAHATIQLEAADYQDTCRMEGSACGCIG